MATSTDQVIPALKTFIGFKSLFYEIFNKRDSLFLPDEILLIIFEKYSPKFKIGQRVIRFYRPYIPIEFMVNIIGLESDFNRQTIKKPRKQNVVITGIDFNKEKGEYYYSYDYYPSSEGFGLESEMRALTNKESHLPHWKLPHDMEPMY